MIGKLKGIVDSVDEEEAVIDVHGVGYTVFCPSRTLAALAVNEAAELVIETHVREDHIHLYGFSTTADREWFRLLTSVQRVGARMALAILGALTPDHIARAIAAHDNTAFSRISGIGPKLAERIVTELKDKAAKTPTGNLPSSLTRAATLGNRKTAGAVAISALEDAVSALTHLGYGRSEAFAAAARVSHQAGEDAPLDELIKKSLKELAG